MDNVNTTTKKGFFKNDRMFVCSMLVFYSLCTIGLIALSVWGLDRRNDVISANTTATQSVIATQNANVTATAIARLEEHDQYEYIERFDAPSNHWMDGPEDDSYWAGDIRVENGVYVWEAKQIKKTFLQWSSFYRGILLDYDTYVDVKFVDGPSGGACGGFVFRKSVSGWEEGAYTFVICNNARLSVYYYEHEEWDMLANEWAFDVIRPADWNRVEISARGSHFVFRVNNTIVFEMDDYRRKVGGLAILLEVNELEPAEVWFDNFGFQAR